MAQRSAREKSRAKTSNEVGLFETIPSNVYASRLHEKFEPIIWSRENQLKQYEKQYLKYNFPHGINEEGDLTFVGKVASRLSSSNRITDQIGQAKKSKKCIMEICHGNKVFELKTFVVLNFNDCNCFKWTPINLNLNEPIPTYALKLGFDVITQSAIYVGRTYTQKNIELIGQVLSCNPHLSAPYKNEVTFHRKYEILCLRPTPVTLKKLCCNKIRKLMKYENSKIEQLEFYIEPGLINHVKYPYYLKCGKQMRRGECLISKNNKYKLSIERNGKLLYYLNENRDFLCLYENVDSLWFNELGLVVCFLDFRTSPFIQRFDDLSIIFKGAKLKLMDDGNLNLESPFHSTKIIIQFRDDIKYYWNSDTPKFDFVYFFEKNTKYKSDDEENEDEDEEDEDENEDDSDDESDDGSDSSDSTSYGSSKTSSDEQN